MIWNETNAKARPGRGGSRPKANGTGRTDPALLDRVKSYLMRPHRQALQAQLADRAAIDRREVRFRDVRLREPRQEQRDRDGDGRAAQNIADAVMRPGAELQNPLGLAMDVEAQRIGEHVRIVVRRQRRRPHHHALEDARAADLGVFQGDPRKREIAVAAEPQAFLQGVRDQRRLVDQLLALVVVGVEQLERAAGRAAGR